MPEATKQLIIERSVRIFGRAELARVLDVPESRLDEWKTGAASLPDAKLLKIADLLADRLNKQLAPK
jgi:hypothetical protein